MGRELIGDCFTTSDDASLEDYERELVVKFIKQECGPAPRGAEVQIGYEDSDYGSYPVVVVIWDDYETGCPELYIEKCIEAFDRFELPEEIHQDRREQSSLFKELNELPNKLFDPD